MRTWYRGIPVLVLALGCLGVLTARAQTAKPASKEPPTAHVMLIRVAPGNFLKWQADNDAVSKEAGLPVGVFYMHTNGDSWDYLQISPDLTKEQQARLDEASQKHGRKIGFPASLEFRQFAAWHTDTSTVGPVSAAELVAMAGK